MATDRLLGTRLRVGRIVESPKFEEERIEDVVAGLTSCQSCFKVRERTTGRRADGPLVGRR